MSHDSSGRGTKSTTSLGLVLFVVWLTFASAVHAAPLTARAAHRTSEVSPTTAEYRRTRDPFSPVPVTTTDALVRLVRTNARVRRLYARHFGVSEARLTDFVSNALRLQRLPQTRPVVSYCARPDGTIYSVNTHIKAGELVWATRSGLPILKWICSNPLTRTLPGTLVATATTARTLVSPKSATFLSTTNDGEPEGTETSLAQEPEGMDAANMQISVALPASAPAVVAAPKLSGTGAEVISVPPTIARSGKISLVGNPSGGSVTGSGMGFAPIATLAAVVPVISAPRKGSAQSSAVTAVETTLQTPPAVVVSGASIAEPMVTPEPGTHLLVCAMLPIVWGMCRRLRPKRS